MAVISPGETAEVVERAGDELSAGEGPEPRGWRQKAE